MARVPAWFPFKEDWAFLVWSEDSHHDEKYYKKKSPNLKNHKELWVSGIKGCILQAQSTHWDMHKHVPLKDENDQLVRDQPEWKTTIYCQINF